MNKPNMKVKEITVSLSGVIPVAAYENLRPGFSITAEPINGESPDTIVTALQEYLHRLMMEESNRSKAEAIEKIYSMIRFYERKNIKYPSVTSIIGHDKNWFGITEDELQQYASEGKILETLCQYYLEDDVWYDPNTIQSLHDDIVTVCRGSLNLRWDTCSYEAFMKQFGEKIKVEAFQKTVYNDEHNYAGTMDILGEFDGKRSVMDFKRQSYDWRQLAAYAACLDGIEQLVVLPIGPTNNKCGYRKPIICDTIQKEFKEFLKARAKFRQRFGI